MKRFSDLEQAQELALAIVDTLPEPFLVLDDRLCLLAASRCFYEVYDEDPAAAHGRSFFELSGGQWNIPGLRRLLRAVLRDLWAGDEELFREHVGDVRERLDHLERFAPLRRALARPPDR